MATNINTGLDPKEVMQKAREEVQEEDLKASVKTYKAKLRELQRAKQVVANIEREIKELELAIEHGNA